MAIIYTYPVKTTPVDADLVLISDSEDSNNTKQVTVSSIKGLTAGVTSVAATLPLVASAATGDTTLSLSGLSALGTAGQVIKVNSGATALEFGTVGGGTFSVQDSGGTAITGIDTLDFNTNLSVSHSSGSSTVTINASSGSSVDTFTNAFGTYITGTANSTATGAVNMGTLNLSASDGSSATTATRFLSKDNEWAVPVYTTGTTYNVMGSGNSYLAGLVLAGSATHNDEFLRKDGTWQATASYSEGTWTPSLTFGGGQAVPTLSTATGNYVIIGKYVYANFYVVVQSGTQYSGSLPRISLPVAAASHNGGILMMSNAYTTASQNTSIILGSVVGGMSIVGLKTMDVSGSEVRIQNLASSPLTYYNNAALSGSIIYLKS